MAADSTLVTASFKEGLSRYGTMVQDLKPLYESDIAISKTTGDIVVGLLKDIKADNKKMQIGRDKQLSQFKRIADEGFQSLYAQSEPMPNKVINALRDRIKDLTEEFKLVNQYGEEDTEEDNNARMRLMGELKRIVSEVVDTRGKFQTILGSADKWNKERINPENISTYQSFLNLKEMDANDDVTVAYIDGRLTFINSATGKQFTAAQMEEGIPALSRKMKIFGQERFTSAGKKGILDGKNNSHGHYDNEIIIKEIEGNYKDEIETEEDFMDASTIEIAAGTGTFKNDLLDHIGISLEIVKNMYYTEDGEVIPIGEVFAKWDKDADGDVDADDVAKIPEEEAEAFKANYKRMMSALTNRFDPAFNLEVSKELFGKWAADKEKQYYNRFFEDNKPRASKEELGSWLGSGNSLRAQGIGGNGYIEYYDALAMYKSLQESVKGIETSFSINNITYKYDPNTKKWSAPGKKEGTTMQGTTFELLEEGFKINHPDFNKFKVKPKKEILDPKKEKEIKIEGKTKTEVGRELEAFLFMEPWKQKDFLGLPRNTSKDDLNKAVNVMINKYKKRLKEFEG